MEVDESLGALSLIGEGVNRDNRNLLRALSVLGGLGVAPGGVTTTGFRISFLVPRTKLLECKRACHVAFIEQPAVCDLDSSAPRGDD